MQVHTGPFSIRSRVRSQFAVCIKHATGPRPSAANRLIRLKARTWRRATRVHARRAAGHPQFRSKHSNGWTILAQMRGKSGSLNLTDVTPMQNAHGP